MHYRVITVGGTNALSPSRNLSWDEAIHVAKLRATGYPTMTHEIVEVKAKVTYEPPPPPQPEYRLIKVIDGYVPK